MATDDNVTVRTAYRPTYRRADALEPGDVICRQYGRVEVVAVREHDGPYRDGETLRIGDAVQIDYRPHNEYRDPGVQTTVVPANMALEVKE